MELRNEFWKVKAYIQQQVDSVHFDAFYKDMQLVGISDNKVEIYTPLAERTELISRLAKPKQLLENAIRAVASRDYKVEFTDQFPVLWADIESDERMFHEVNSRWNEILLYLRENFSMVSDNDFRRFYSAVRPVYYHNGILVVSAGIEGGATHLRKRVRLIEESTRAVLRGGDVKVEVFTQGELENNHKGIPPALSYGFSNFRINEKNKAAYVALYGMAKAFPATILYDPLFISGPEASGKSHLVESAMSFIRHRVTNVQISYLTPENTFLLRSAAAESLFCEDDILVIDEVERMGDKAKPLNRILQQRYQCAAQTIIVSRLSAAEVEKNTGIELVNLLNFGLEVVTA